MKENRNTCTPQRVLAIFVALMLLQAFAMPLSVLAAKGDPPVVVAGNLLQNPDFEQQMQGWETSSGTAGFQTNNVHTGNFGFYVDRNIANYIRQAVEVPYNGWYRASGYIATGGAGGKYGVTDENHEYLASVDLPSGANYASAHIVPLVQLQQGQTVYVRVSGATSSWVNGDDLAFVYDTSNVGYNLLTDVDITQAPAVEIRMPNPGDYNFSAVVAAGENDAVVTVGDQSSTVPAGETQTVELLVTVAKDDLLAVSVTGGTVADASLLLDLSSVPNEPPVATDVAIVGEELTGVQLVADYTFTDPDVGQTEGASRYQWYSCDAVDGEYTPLEGETSLLLVLDDSQEDKYVLFEVTPVDSYSLAGQPVRSAPVGPVTINWVRNPGLEIEVQQSPEGWATSGSGASLPNSPTNAHAGFRLVRINANSTTGEARYALTAGRTAYYTASAWLNLPTGETTLGVKLAATGEVLGSGIVQGAAGGYTQVFVEDIPIERGTEIVLFILGNSGDTVLYADDFALVVDKTKDIPRRTNLHSFSIEGQARAEINAEQRTVHVTMPYGADVTSLLVHADYSDGATLQPESGSYVDFTSPVEFVLRNGSEPAVTWTVSVTVADKMVALESDNAFLEENFNWAVQKTQQFVVTDKSVPFEMWAGRPSAGDIVGAPGYWAGYYDRSAYYSRDFVHQATGAQLVGLEEENYQMFKAFAGTATAEHKWYAVWALNFDNITPLGIDYKSATNFVREVPAQFELVEKAYKQYLWSGDERYIADDMFFFYTKVMTEYIELHDTNGNGVAEGAGTGNIFAGSPTYNERGNEHPIEAGDAIGSQYQATLAYAGFLLARGDAAGYAEWMDKAAELKRYFNEEWSVKAGDPNGHYVRALGKDGTQYNDFGKENSWFMPMKLITEPGERNNAYLDYILENLGGGIGSGGEAPANIEAYTYIPDTYFAYNRANDAWKWMKYIMERKDLPHERAVQGTNGDYPEVSYTFVSHVVEGMMGVEPDARLNQVATVPRLPDEVGEVTLRYLSLGANELLLTHKGNQSSTLTNVEGDKTVEWIVRFYGSWPSIEINGVAQQGTVSLLNGETITTATTQVAPGTAATAVAIASGDRAALAELYSTESAREEDDYTPGSWAPFSAALAKAAQVLAQGSGASPDDIDAAYLALSAAAAALVAHGIDFAPLRGIIAEAEGIIANRDKYITSAVEKLEALLEDAYALLNSDDASQNKADSMASALLAAMGETFEKGSTAALANLVNAVAGYKAADYTPATWQVFADALAAAHGILANPSEASQAAVDKAYATLLAAEGALVRKASFSELDDAITAAAAILADSDAYAPASLQGLAEALKTARNVRANSNTSQAEADAARAALNAKTLAARKRADLTALRNALAAAKALTEGNYSADSWDALAKAIATGEAHVADPNVHQVTVDNATASITAAHNALIARDGDGSNDAGNVSTGDTADTIGYLLAASFMAIALAGLAFYRWKKRNTQ